MANDNATPSHTGRRARLLAESADLTAAAKVADQPHRAKTLRRMAKITRLAAMALRAGGRDPS